MKNKEEELVKQIRIVINMLQKRLVSDPNRPILITLYKRYIRAEEIITNCEEKNKIMIKGSCRAYLDAFSDYDNPILSEMNKSEKLLNELTKNN